MKTDAAGCWRNSQAIYTHNPFHPIVGITGFCFLNDLRRVPETFASLGVALGWEGRQAAHSFCSLFT